MVPILVLSGRSTLNDTVNSLDCGADDFVTKPVHPDELLARVRAVLRRQPNLTSETLEAGNLILDTISGEVMCSRSRVSLMKSEQRLLAILMRRAGHIVPKSTLEDALTKLGGESTPNAIEKTVSRLRKSISRVPAAVQIKTAAGIGYSLESIVAQSTRT
jgi:DNA-binding response OmpR family regulator